MSVIYSKPQSQMESAPDYRQPLIIAQPPLPTVAIVSDATASGFLIINASDFDAATMTRYEPNVPPAVDRTAKAKK